MRVKGSSSSAAFATTFCPYLLVLGERAVLVTSSAPIVLCVRYRGFWRPHRRQSLCRDTERKKAASCVCSRVVKQRTPSQRLRAFYLTRSSGNTARTTVLHHCCGGAAAVCRAATALSGAARSCKTRV
jgi:hypothetical protein